jgi:hypothetical protein
MCKHAACKIESMASYWEYRMEHRALAYAAPLAPITLPAEVIQEAPSNAPRVEERWMEELQYYMAVGIFDPRMVLELQVQHLEHSLKMVMDEVLLQEAERTAINVAECALSE